MDTNQFSISPENHVTANILKGKPSNWSEVRKLADGLIQSSRKSLGVLGHKLEETGSEQSVLICIGTPSDRNRFLMSFRQAVEHLASRTRAGSVIALTRGIANASSQDTPISRDQILQAQASGSILRHFLDTCEMLTYSQTPGLSEKMDTFFGPGALQGAQFRLTSQAYEDGNGEIAKAIKAADTLCPTTEEILTYVTTSAPKIPAPILTSLRTALPHLGFTS